MEGQGDKRGMTASSGNCEGSPRELVKLGRAQKPKDPSLCLLSFVKLSIIDLSNNTDFFP